MPLDCLSLSFALSSDGQRPLLIHQLNLFVASLHFSYSSPQAVVCSNCQVNILCIYLLQFGQAFVKMIFVVLTQEINEKLSSRT